MKPKYFYAASLVLFFGAFVPALVWGAEGFLIPFALAGLSIGIGCALGIIQDF
jgi:hypothetical protein